MKLKVAVLQKRSLDRQFAKSTEIVLGRMQEAAEHGADILLLPEAFLTGYELPMTNGEALSDDSPYLLKICNAAKALRLGVVVTAITKGRQKPQNAAYVVDKSGTVLMKYAKVHTCDFADEACLESVDSFWGMRLPWRQAGRHDLLRSRISRKRTRTDAQGSGNHPCSE